MFDDVYISWEGKEYCITPTFQMLRRLEGQGISIAGVAARTAGGQPPMSQVAEIIAFLLQQQGVKATAEKVYEEMCYSNRQDVADLTTVVLSAFFPKKKTNNDTAKSTKKKAQPKKSTGKSTLK